MLVPPPNSLNGFKSPTLLRPPRAGNALSVSLCLPFNGLHLGRTLNRHVSTYLGHLRCRAALKTQSLSSKISNKQAVFLRAGASSGTVWQFQKTTHGKDGRVDRILGVGSPVFAGTEV